MQKQHPLRRILARQGRLRLQNRLQNTLHNGPPKPSMRRRSAESPPGNLAIPADSQRSVQQQYALRENGLEPLRQGEGVGAREMLTETGNGGLLGDTVRRNRRRFDDAARAHRSSERGGFPRIQGDVKHRDPRRGL